MDGTVEAVEQISEAEARFERWRRAGGFVLALAALMLVLLPGLQPEPYWRAAVTAGHCVTMGDADLIG